MSLSGELRQEFDKHANVVSQIISDFKQFKDNDEMYKKERHDFKEKIEKMAEDSADAIERLNAITKEKETLETAVKNIEKSLNRIGNAAVSPKNKGLALDDIERQKVKILNKYLRGRNPNGMSSYESVDLMEKRVENSLLKNLHFLNDADHDNVRSIRKTVLEGINPQGGYFILPYEYLGERITRIFETSPIRQYSSVHQASKPVINMVIDDDETGAPTTGGEQTTIATTATPGIGLAKFEIYMISEKLYVSLDMIEDASFDIGTWVVTKGADKIARTQNTAFVLGTGSNEAKGILSYGKWTGAAVAVGDTDNYTRNALEYIKSGNNTALTYAGLVNLQNALLENYQNDAIFMMKRQSWGQVLQLVDSQNRPLFQLQNLLNVGATNNRILLGNPVVFASDIPGPTGTNTYTQNDAVIIYGDFKTAYMVFDRIGFYVFEDPYTSSDSQLVKYILRARYGGGLTNYQALKVLQITA